MNEHQHTQLNLAWYVNGTLVGDEYAKAHRHIQTCLICRQDLSRQRRLAAEVANAPASNASAATALSHINSRLHTLDSFGARFWTTFSRPLSSMQPPLRIGLAVTLLLAAFGLGLLLTSTNYFFNATAGEYRTLSSQDSTLIDTDTKSVRLLLAEDMAVHDFEKLLHSVNATISDGPTERGIYTLRFEDDATMDVIHQLRQHPLVLFAEPNGTFQNHNTPTK